MIGEKIAALRKKHKLTQASFAEQIHVTQGAVSQWETGRTNPDTFQLLQIANYFNVDLQELTDDVPQSAIAYPGSIKDRRTSYGGTIENIHRWKSAVQIANSENYSESHGENSGITYDRPLYETPETSIFSRGSGMNRETPLDAAPDQMTIDERFSRLSPERRKQALDFLNFLEQQPDE